MSSKMQIESEKKEVFCPYIHRNGVIIYPKNSRYFHFFVKA